MLTPRQIIARLGGPRPAARTLKLPASTVASWSKRGLIPQKHIPALLAAAQKADIDLSIHDFIKLPDMRKAS